MQPFIYLFTRIFAAPAFVTSRPPSTNSNTKSSPLRHVSLADRAQELRSVNRPRPPPTVSSTKCTRISEVLMFVRLCSPSHILFPLLLGDQRSQNEAASKKRVNWKFSHCVHVCYTTVLQELSDERVHCPRHLHYSREAAAMHTKQKSSSTCVGQTIQESAKTRAAMHARSEKL